MCRKFRSDRLRLQDATQQSEQGTFATAARAMQKHLFRAVDRSMVNTQANSLTGPGKLQVVEMASVGHDVIKVQEQCG